MTKSAGHQPVGFLVIPQRHFHWRGRQFFIFVKSSFLEGLPIYQDRFDQHQCCVLIPTYNNGKTLEKVLREILTYTKNIIVVNDGSTDETASILNKIDALHVVTIDQNKGKGNALRRGFREAWRLAYTQAITMDSDGQHFPDDLVVFLDALDNHKPQDPEQLIVGSRTMDHPDIPHKSSYGNRCSSFWFWVETGIKLDDTQCGYRLYPLKIINDLNLFTSKFELEIEVIVKAAWRGADVKNLPVKVFYDPTERVTHFRPFQDVARITLLNIWFVICAIIYFRPRNLLRKLGKHENKDSKKTFSKTNLPLE